MVFCSKCGSENPNGSAYCYNCGTKLLTEIPVRKGISQLVVTGKCPMPKADERAEMPRYQVTYHDERAMMNETVRPPGDGSYGTIPEGYELRPIKPKRNDLLIIGVTIFIICVILVAAVAMVLVNANNGNISGPESNTSVGGIKDGSYADYKVTAYNGSQAAIGTARLSYDNVTSTSMTITFTISLDGDLVMTSQKFVLKDNIWQSTDGADSIGTTGIAATTFENLGTESMRTAIGTKECTHTRTTSPAFLENDWYTQSGCFVKMEIWYASGFSYEFVVMEIIGTNISDA